MTCPTLAEEIARIKAEFLAAIKADAMVIRPR